MRKLQKRFVAFILTFSMVISSSAFVIAEENYRYDNGPAYDYELTYDYVSEETYGYNNDTAYENGIVFVDDFLNEPEFVADLRAELVEEFGEAFMDNHDRASEMVDTFMDSLPQRRDGTIIYPESFGGIYIDSDGNLVVLIVGDSVEGTVMEAMGRTVGTDIRFVEFSFAEVESVWQAIYDYMEIYGYRPDEHVVVDCPVMNNLSAISIDVISNKVNVYLYDASQYSIDIFRSMVIDHPILNFKSEPDIPVGYVAYIGLYNADEDYNLQRGLIAPFSVRSGQAIYIRYTQTMARASSIGFRARCRSNRNLGFVTHAHGLQVGTRFYRNRTINAANFVGTVSRRNLSTDTSFVTLSTSASMLNSAVNGTTIGAVMHNNQAVGQAVTRISDGGINSARTSSGTIRELNRTINVPTVGNVRTHLASYLSDGGDSGGIIIRSVGATAQISGIHLGRHSAANAVFVPTPNVLVGLNVDLH